MDQRGLRLESPKLVRIYVSHPGRSDDTKWERGSVVKEEGMVSRGKESTGLGERLDVEGEGEEGILTVKSQVCL